MIDDTPLSNDNSYRYLLARVYTAILSWSNDKESKGNLPHSSISPFGKEADNDQIEEILKEFVDERHAAH